MNNKTVLNQLIIVMSFHQVIFLNAVNATKTICLEMNLNIAKNLFKIVSLYN